MAGAGYKLFNTGDVLTAAEVNTYLQQQVTMVFANASARTSALSGVLAEGMMSYLQDTNAVEVYDGSSWVNVGNAGDITAVTAGTGLTGGGTSGAVTLTNDMATTITAKGDLLVGTGNATYDNLAVGTNGYTLVADSSTATGLKWEAISAGGMTQLATGTLSGSAVNITSISGSYKDLRLVVRNYRPANDDVALNLRFNNDSNTRYADPSAFSNTASVFGSSGIRIVQGTDDGTSQSLCIVHIFDYANTTTWKTLFNQSISNDPLTSTQYGMRFISGYYNQTAAISQINLFPASGNFTSGEYILYGVS